MSNQPEIPTLVFATDFAAPDSPMTNSPRHHLSSCRRNWLGCEDTDSDVTLSYHPYAGLNDDSYSILSDKKKKSYIPHMFGCCLFFIVLIAVFFLASRGYFND